MPALRLGRTGFGRLRSRSLGSTLPESARSTVAWRRSTSLGLRSSMRLHVQAKAVLALRSQFVILERGDHLKYAPYVFAGSKRDCNWVKYRLLRAIMSWSGCGDKSYAPSGALYSHASIPHGLRRGLLDRKSTRLNSSHLGI